MVWLSRANRTTEGILTLACGVLVGFLAIYLNVFNASNKITAVVVGALLAVIVVLLIGKLQRLLLAVVFLDLATGTDFHVTCNADYFLSSCGLNISLTTLALVGLYVLWVVAIRRGDTEGDDYVRRPRFGVIGKAAVGFIFAAILSLLAARNVGIAMYQIWVYLTLLALFFYLANNINTREELLFVVGLIVVGLFIQNVFMELGTLGIIEKSTTSKLVQRVNGTFNSFNSAGAYLAQIFSILLACLAIPMRRWQKWFLSITLLLAIYNLVGTESRGGWTSVLIGISVVGFVSLARGWMKIKTLVLALIVVTFFALLFSGTIISRLTGDDHGAADARGPLADIAFNMIRDNPIVGVGANNFGVALKDYIEPEQFGAWLNLVHNGWLLVWAETGTVGIIFYAIFWLTIFWQASRLIKSGHPYYAPIAVGVVASMLGTSMHMMVEIFGSRILSQIIWTEAALIMAMARLYERETRLANAPIQPITVSDPSDVITLLPERKRV
jgi:O-antigen ligase